MQERRAALDLDLAHDLDLPPTAGRNAPSRRRRSRREPPRTAGGAAVKISDQREPTAHALAGADGRGGASEKAKEDEKQRRTIGDRRGTD